MTTESKTITNLLLEGDELGHSLIFTGYNNQGQPEFKNHPATNGYFVSVDTDYILPGEMRFDALVSAIVNIWLVTSYESGLFLGLWFDTTNDVWHINGSLWIENASEAYGVARLNNQKAVYSVKSQRSVFI